MGAVATNKNIDALQNILVKNAEMENELEELRARNAELRDQIKQNERDLKDLEEFRPLLENIPVQYYKVQLRESSMMKMLFGRMLKLYGRRFKYDPETATDGDKQFVRQCLDATVLACVRYCVMQNSRWNDMVAHYLS